MSEPAQAEPRRTERLMSLDALRGFDMFCIVGADSLGYALAHLEGAPMVAALAHQMEHVAWAGFRFYDLIFPLFAFLIGVSITFSLRRICETEGRAAAVGRVLRRAALLYVLGLFYYGGFSTPFDHIRYVGVLQRLAWVYLGAGLLFVYCRPRALVVAVVGLLVGYWAVMAWVPIRDLRLDTEPLALLAEQQGKPEIARALRDSKNPSIDVDRRGWEFAEAAYAATTREVRGQFEPGYNLANHVDFLYLPGRKWDGFYDPEGLLSNLPAIASSLLGVLAGLRLRSSARSPRRNAAYLGATGVACLALGLVWGSEFPVIKKIWTSSFVLVAGGWSFLLLAGFYWVIDVWKVRAWAWPFVWIGANPLAIYLLSNIVDFEKLSARFVGGDIARHLNELWPGLGGVTLAVTGAALSIWICRFLYRRSIFLRV